MAAATAFFTTFAVTPILIIIIQLLGLFIAPDRVRTALIERLIGVVGTKSARQIQEILNNIIGLAGNWYVTLIGFIFLMFVATTLFQVIEDSLDDIWQIRIKKDAGFGYKLRRRFRSLLIIGLAGILFILGLLTEWMQGFLGNYIDYLMPQASWLLNYILNEVIFVIIVAVWFTCIFKYLTDGRPSWRVAVAGGFLTTVLFTFGKIVVNWGLSRSNISTVYGTSGSIIIIQLFVFYSALIFYFGGSFIKVLSDYWNEPIRAVRGASHYEILEV
ncbi:YihY/virulence factor BrkB family protein [Pedobacter sp. SYSU D00535]|uniref:YihY/virulence factor BrkB family protein n=1 Tax=Pedobacter sp. SYSU D00535 TaxID=2810308 RepID=UPI001A960B55|nr:YihY/virulence factor BrkB family protein [Pedobacter sp. SYSU D00535]